MKNWDIRRDRYGKKVRIERSFRVSIYFPTSLAVQPREVFDCLTGLNCGASAKTKAFSQGYKNAIKRLPLSAPSTKLG